MDEPSECDCEHFLRQIEALVDHNLDEVQARVLFDHIRGCPSCSNARDAEIHLRDRIRECMRVAPAQVPMHLRARIMVSIHKETMVRLRPIRPALPPDSGQDLGH